MIATSQQWALWSCALLLVSPTGAFLPPIRPRQLDPTTFNWSAITPTADLRYHPCFDSFKCARLRVPLDWSGTAQNLTSVTRKWRRDEDGGAYAAIAITVLPAVVPPTDPSYAGPILINPGGPGGAGTDMALAYGEALQQLVDTPGERHFDILGFDPRGTGKSTPSAMCYPSEFDRAIGALQLASFPSVSTEIGLMTQFEYLRGEGQLCKSNEGNGDIFRYMSTASVARDMLEIVERSAVLNGNGTRVGRRCAEKPRLQYIGFSYGTFLGNTFASMFPDRVGRMVVDGIVDADDYIAGIFSKNAVDAEKAIDVFYQTCFDAGELCPLRQTQDGSASDIRQRVDSFLRSIEESPISVVQNGGVNLITAFFVREMIRTALYNPIRVYETLAKTLAGILAGNYTGLFSPNTQEALCQQVPETSPPQTYTWAREATSGVICGDSYALAGDRNVSWARSLAARVIAQSPTTSDGWLRVALGCAGWDISPDYVFHGPFGSPAPGNKSAPAAPLLILSTEVDHATPLENAFTLSRFHKGSSVVVQEGIGHCALLSSTSNCTSGIVREYFRTGTVPANGTFCASDCRPGIPFKGCPGLPGSA